MARPKTLSTSWFKHSLKKQACGSLIFSWTSRMACSPWNCTQAVQLHVTHVDQSSNFLELFCKDLDLQHANGWDVWESQPCGGNCTCWFNSAILFSRSIFSSECSKTACQVCQASHILTSRPCTAMRYQTYITQLRSIFQRRALVLPPTVARSRSRDCFLLFLDRDNSRHCPHFRASEPKQTQRFQRCQHRGPSPCVADHPWMDLPRRP